MTEAISIGRLASTFLKLGVTSFGGPAAHIAMMEEEVVRKNAWLSRAEFLDLLGMTNLIPGPNSTEMAIHIGLKKAGFLGLLVCGISFILPAMLLVWALAWVYVRCGTLPQVTGALYGIKPVVIAVVFQALWRLGRTAIKSIPLGFICLLSLALSLFGISELLILVGGGLLMMGQNRLQKFRGPKAKSGLFLGLTLLTPLYGAAATATELLTSISPTQLFISFLKIGSLIFGSGYVLLAFLEAEFVQNGQWLTQTQLMDAVTVGQFTPGPVFTAATFIGYLMAGHSGALLATLGIFLPAFLFVALSGVFIPYLRKSILAGSFLDGVNVSSLALMAVVTVSLGRASIVDTPTAFISALSGILLFGFRVNSLWLMLAGGIVGGIISL